MISTPYKAKIQFGRLLSLPENESTHPIQRKCNFMALWCFYDVVYNNTLTKLLIDKN